MVKNKVSKLKYNFKIKDDELLQIYYFVDEFSLVSDIINILSQLKQGEYIDIFAKSELSEFLIQFLHGQREDSNLDKTIKFGVIDFDAKGCDYNDIFCISINSDYELWVEPAYRRDKETGEYKLFNSEANLAYVYQEDCKQDLINKLEKNKVPTLLFGFGED